jgi:hypothetical protein
VDHALHRLEDVDVDSHHRHGLVDLTDTSDQGVPQVPKKSSLDVLDTGIVGEKRCHPHDVVIASGDDVSFQETCLIRSTEIVALGSSRDNSSKQAQVRGAYLRTKEEQIAPIVDAMETRATRVE